MKFIKNIVILSVLISILSGCMTLATGPRFKNIEPAPENMAAIYVYRPAKTFGHAVNLAIVDNGVQRLEIQNGQFKRYLAIPGNHKIHSDTWQIDKVINFNVEAGKTYFVRAGVRTNGFTTTWYLNKVDEEEALNDLLICCKSGEAETFI